MAHETVRLEKVPPHLAFTLVNMTFPAFFAENFSGLILVQMHTIFNIHCDGQFRDRVCRIIRKDLNCLGYAACFAPDINRHINLAALPWSQMTLTSHHRSAASGSLEFVYDKLLITRVGKFEYMFDLSFLRDRSEIKIRLTEAYRWLSIGRRCNEEQTT